MTLTESNDLLFAEMLVDEPVCLLVSVMHVQVCCTACFVVVNGPLPWTTQVRRYHKGKTNLDFTGAY